MLDSGFMPPVIWARNDRNDYDCGCVVATREKTSISCPRALCWLHYTLFLTQLSVACNLIPRVYSDDTLMVDF